MTKSAVLASTVAVLAASAVMYRVLSHRSGQISANVEGELGRVNGRGKSHKNGSHRRSKRPAAGRRKTA
jgi:hypothetical protein